MILLTMLRHGATEWSLDRRIQGRTDVPLCDAGRALLMRRRLPHQIHGVRVVCSPLVRCVETASLLGLEEVECDSRLAEMRWGSWEGRRLPELRAELGEAMRENEDRGLDFAPPGGESPREVLVRVVGWLAEVAARDQPTLAISHKGIIRVIFAAATGWDMRGRPPLKLDWDAAHQFGLDPAGVPSVVQMNIPLPRPSVS